MDRTEERKQRYLRKCKHFSGINNKTCYAGVIYDDLDKEHRVAYRKNLPCLDNNEGPCPCPKFEARTLEELEERDKRIQGVIERMQKVNEVLRPIREQHHGKSGHGTIDCPICKSKLHWGISGYNGHMQVRCEGEDCVSWIE